MATTPTRQGTTIPLSSLASDARRSERTAALKKLEQALRTDGWVRVVHEGLATPTQDVYDSAADIFSRPDVCAAHKREVLSNHLAFTYLGADEEPLYDEHASKQFVHSLNIQEVLSAEACDLRLHGQPGYDDEERMLAHAYHAWPLGEATQSMREAGARLRHSLAAHACGPLLRAFALLLGLEEGWLAERCAMRRSDNTSLLRCLEYPPLPSSSASAHAHADGAIWGVSAHTDFELFSLLSEQAPGLEVADPSGRWHSPAPASTSAGDDAVDGAATSAWVVIVGDMLEILSAGYWVATPHRVRPTCATMAQPRRSLVFFQGLDENEPLAPLRALPSGRRTPTGGFPRWCEARREEDAAHAGSGRRVGDAVVGPGVPGGAAACVTQPVTQREWTELKERLATERLRERERQAAEAS